MSFLNAHEIARMKALEASAIKVTHLDDTTENTILFLKSLTQNTAPIFFGTYAQHRLNAIGARFLKKDGWYHCSQQTLVRHIATIEKHMILRVARKLEKA